MVSTMVSKWYEMDFEGCQNNRTPLERNFVPEARRAQSRLSGDEGMVSES